jgi:two-component system response regulator AtoC
LLSNKATFMCLFSKPMKLKKRYTLFIIEDGESYSFMLKYKLLRSSDYKIISFHTAEECISTLHLNPDIVIMDYKLPRMDGIEVLHALKKMAPRVPVIILSAQEDKAVFLEFIKAGAFEYLLKEDDSTRLADKLLKKVVNVLEEKEGRERILRRWQFALAVLIVLLILAAVIWIAH